MGGIGQFESQAEHGVKMRTCINIQSEDCSHNIFIHFWTGETLLSVSAWNNKKTTWQYFKRSESDAIRMAAKNMNAGHSVEEFVY